MSNHPVKDIVETIGVKCRQFEESFSQKDAHGLVENYYTDEPIVSGDGVGLVTGRPGVRQYFEQIFQVFRQCCFETKIVRREGNMAYELGDITLSPVESGTENTTLRYSVIWKWQDSDGWRAEVDYFAIVAE